MRFYFGFSKRIPFKWIILVLAAILAFFGISYQAHALTISDLDYVKVIDVGNAGGGVISGTDTHYIFSNPYTNSDGDEFLVFPYQFTYDEYNTTSTGHSNDILSWTFTFESNQNWLLCQADNGVVICPMIKNYTYTGIYIKWASSLTSGSNYYLTFNSRYAYVYNSKNKQTYNTIIQQQQDIITSQNDINNSINNSQVDSSSTSGGGFFDNFSVDDSRGFSSIITAPLQFLRDLLTSNDSCNPLSFNIEMKDDNISVSNTGLQLPCGNVLWNRVPQTIEVIWVTLVWGLVGYRLLLDMVKFINNSLNPEYSKEYFLDL